MSIASKLTLAFVLLLVASPALGKEAQGRVYWYADGDSFKFKYDKGRDECRMLGYNPPEWNEKGPPSGKAVKKKLMSLIDKKDIRIMSTKRDKYKRLLCDVWLSDGTHVNNVMRTWLEDKGYKGVGKYDWMERRDSRPVH
jgi:endonuclease YncB( thermonuclease family)